jgi:hypothetical protein
MVERSGIAILLGALAAVACDDRIEQPKVVQLKHDERGVTGDAGHTIPPPECSAACCPKVADAPECYFEGMNPSRHSGAECLAQRDNTDKPHWQFRQTQSISTAPPGNAEQLLATVLVRRSELKSQACGAPNAMSGFIQLIDVDRSTGVALTGFAAFVLEQSAALAQGGLCFVDGEYDDVAEWRIPELYAPPAGWPEGLPPPLPLPWKSIGPVRGKPLDEDFDVKANREQILGWFKDGGELKSQNFNGIFYLDEARGYMHGFAPLGYIITYDPPDPATGKMAFNAIPIREAEITTQLNDPAHPNCSGVYGTNDELPDDCGGAPATPAWSCPSGNCATGVFGPTKVEGYFLIAELEQVNLRLLKHSLCYQAVSGSYDGWTLTANDKGESRCRDNTKWKPTDSVDGIPPGDWCATTNSPRTDTCHDAWKSVSYSTFQAFPIQDNPCPPL